MPEDPIAQEYRRLTPKSRKVWERTGKYIAGGLSSTGSMVPYPTYIVRAEGPYLYDADGRRITDFMNGSMGLPLGHNPPAVRKALQEQIKNGMFYTLASVYEERLAKLICGRIPSVEKVRFAPTGSEATMFALRIARAFTGRGKIAKMDGGYHGNHDVAWIGLGKNYLRDPQQTAAGLMPGTAESVVRLQFNHTEECERLITRHKDELAAVIVEPVLGGGGCITPIPGFLEMLREVTKRHGIILIFDEMISLPLSKGGAQKHYGVIPDMTTAGKSAGGGIPFGFFGGREDLMALTAPGPSGERPIVNHVATYSGHPLAMVAGAAALEAMTPAVYKYIHSLGEMVRSEMRALFARMELPIKVTGVGHMFCYHWSEADVWDWQTSAAARADLSGKLGMALFNKGYFARGRGIVTAATKPAHVKGLITAMEGALVETGLAG